VEAATLSNPELHLHPGVHWCVQFPGPGVHTAFPGRSRASIPWAPGLQLQSRAHAGVPHCERCERGCAAGFPPGGLGWIVRGCIGGKGPEEAWATEKSYLLGPGLGHVSSHVWFPCHSLPGMYWSRGQWRIFFLLGVATEISLGQHFMWSCWNFWAKLLCALPCSLNSCQSLYLCASVFSSSQQGLLNKGEAVWNNVEASAEPLLNEVTTACKQGV
jgi:hypothetical protein